MFPAIYKGKVTAPNVWMISDYHPWESSPNLEYYSYRHDLEWKDKIYGDVSYSKIDDNSNIKELKRLLIYQFNMSILVLTNIGNLARLKLPSN